MSDSIKKCKCVTFVDEEKSSLFEMEWKIQREVFQKLVQEENGYRLSSEHKSDFHDFSYQFKLSHSQKFSEHLGLCLERVTPKKPNVNFWVKWNYTIKNKSQDIHDKNDQKWYDLNSLGVGYESWKLIKTLESEDFWHDNFLIIIFEVEMKILGKERTEINLELSTPVKKDKTSQKLQTLLDTGDYADVTVSVGSEKFKVHKNILAMNSEYFDTMFKSGFKEAKAEEFEIKDVMPDIFKSIIEFIYAHKIPVDIEYKAKDILVTAHLFCLPTLVEICEQALSKSVCLENCADLMILAETYGLQYLKQNGINFIKNNLKGVFNSEQWKKLKIQNSQLAFEIVEKLV